MTRRLYSKPPLLGPLSFLLPTDEQTWLLQACLWSGKRGEQAWSRWSAGIDDPASFLRQDKYGVKGLLPLLFDSLQHKAVFIDKEFQTYLRTAYLRDELRSRSYGRICREVTETFSSAGIPAIVLKGAALAETAYKTAALQHAHYLDILIKVADYEPALEVLASLGFIRSTVRADSEPQAIELVHESGLPLILHRQLFRVPFYNVAMEEIWARSRIQTVSGAPTGLLSPADNLLHICGSVFDVESHESLRWVCDAWFLIQRYPDLNWRVLLDYSRRSPIALPLYLTLDYLVEAVDASIPVDVLNRLRAAASKTDSLDREVVLFTVQTNPRGGLKRIIQNSGDWRTRALVLKWALFPSPRYLRWVHKIRWAWLLPLYYVYRPLRYLVRYSWSSCWRFARRLRVLMSATRPSYKAVSSGPTVLP